MVITHFEGIKNQPIERNNRPLENWHQWASQTKQWDVYKINTMMTGIGDRRFKKIRRFKDDQPYGTDQLPPEIQCCSSVVS